MKLPLILLSGAALVLSGCGVAPGAGGVNPRVSSTGMRPATNDQRGAAQGERGGAINAGDMMGRDRAALISQFGPPRLDATEGQALRLQFSSDRCVLDAYLYPPRAGATAVVTHVDARNPAGEDVDRAACIAALRRR